MHNAWQHKAEAMGPQTIIHSFIQISASSQPTFFLFHASGVSLLVSLWPHTMPFSEGIKRDEQQACRRNKATWHVTLVIEIPVLFERSQVVGVVSSCLKSLRRHFAERAAWNFLFSKMHTNWKLRIYIHTCSVSTRIQSKWSQEVLINCQTNKLNTQQIQ